jgi:hypothetical protein
MPDTDTDATLTPDVLAHALLRLRAEGDHESADALLASLGGDGEAGDAPDMDTEQKAMSSLTGSGGGFLVPDGCGAARRRKRKAAKWLRRQLKSLGG